NLGARLARDPARVSRALEGSKQGTELKIERWEGLGRMLVQGPWNESQCRLAQDLLGVPPELRPEVTSPPPPGEAAALVEHELERLRCRKSEVLDELNEMHRAWAAGGMPLVEDAMAR